MSDNELFKIPEEALKKIKTQEEFEDYIQRLYKQGVEALLKAASRLSQVRSCR